ncbi:MAG: hypothetical protein M1826_000551 [Phylliscum demangeonii]|nr:MAG: hypothetical protein M1826_000551 [Phylliscum demangeonii]
MSLESALDEERREILKLLEAPRAPRPGRSSFSQGSNWPADLNAREKSPVSGHSPVRSMLDVGSDPARPSHASSVPPQQPPRPPRTQTVRSLLDPTDSPPASPALVKSVSDESSAVDPRLENRQAHRSASDAGSHPPVGSGPRLLRDRDKAASALPSPNTDYSFAMAPSTQGAALPKRVMQGGRKSSKLSQSTMARVMQTMDFGGDGGRASERGRVSMAGGSSVSGPTSSRSPTARFGRSQSPHTRILHANTVNLTNAPGTIRSDGGQLLDINNAYRRLSDAHLARSGGSLSNLPQRAATTTTATDPTIAEEEAGPASAGAGAGRDRLHKDYAYGMDGEEGALMDSSDDNDDDSDRSSAADEPADHEPRRGRAGEGARGPSLGAGGAVFVGQRALKDKDGAGGPLVETTLGMGQAQGGPRKTLSLLAAAEEERKQVLSKYTVRSLLDPAPPPPVTVTGPSGERLALGRGKSSVHPSTSFDASGSTPVTSDTEADMSDIRRAQRMHISMSAISSTPASHRSIRTIVRGEFLQLQDDLDDGEREGEGEPEAGGARRHRIYLVATDLSDEAAYALEWTIGTILRDGDTLLAVYAVDEEGAAADEAGSGSMTAKDQAAAALVGALTPMPMPMLPAPTTASALPTTLPTLPLGAGMGSTTRNLSPLSQSAYVVAAATDDASSTTTTAITAAAPPTTAASARASPDSRHLTAAEQERYRATDDISQRCLKLLRKTRLQVRVVVEVIHCKSPKHLITEVIDFIDPTLVILGSRGRSALKGVLLGSFSNYLVTKSSVPVMVARKRLRKLSRSKRSGAAASSAAAPANVRQANNLLAVRGLAGAKID